jgi:hypothetical protein
LQLLSLNLHSVRDVHQLRFHAFIVTCSAAAESPKSQRQAAAVVLSGWSFVQLETHAPRHLGFRVIGTLVQHPKKDASCNGMAWYSTEMTRMLFERVMRSENGTLYRLEGPADATWHDDQSRIANIMQPFCQSMWPLNDRELLDEVSKFFTTEQEAEREQEAKIPVHLPQSA